MVQGPITGRTIAFDEEPADKPTEVPFPINPLIIFLFLQMMVPNGGLQRGNIMSD